MRNATGVSHTASVRGQFHADELSVLFFTGMTVESLTDFKLDTGREWLMKYCTGQAGFSWQDAAEMWKEPQLLQWWNLEWRRMDHFIILPMLHKIVEQERGEVYRAMHTDVFLSKHPNNVILQLSLARVLGRMVKTESNAEQTR